MLIGHMLLNVAVSCLKVSLKVFGLPITLTMLRVKTIKKRIRSMLLVSQ